MAIPPPHLSALHGGCSLAAPVPTDDPRRVGFVEVIPLCPSPPVVAGYEVRYVEHDAAYLADSWDWDAELILADETTWMRRALVTREDEIEGALAPWLPDGAGLGPSQDVGSPLVGVVVGAPGRYPNLWR